MGLSWLTIGLDQCEFSRDRMRGTASERARPDAWGLSRSDVCVGRVCTDGIKVRGTGRKAFLRRRIKIDRP
jgi:hypothetical protein